MAWEVQFEKRAEKDLDKIPSRYRKKVLAILPVIAREPFTGKKLEGELKGFYSYRVWPYRIIYKIYEKVLIVVVVRIGHRQGIYE